MSRVEIPLTTGGYVVIIDEADLSLVSGYKWRPMVVKGGKIVYARTSVPKDGKQYDLLMHRLLLGAPKGLQVDHEDGNGLHNWRSNIRLATHQQNTWNRKLTKANKSGLFGVFWRPRNKRFVAAIRKDGKPKHLGHFLSAAEAAFVYDTAAKELHGEFARLNFPDFQRVSAA